MTRFRKFLPSMGALLVGAAILAAPAQAQATFQIRVSTDGGANFGAAVSDNQIGQDFNPATGIITINVGGLLVTATTTGGTSQPLSTLTLNVSSTGVGTVASSTGLVVQASMDFLQTAPPPQTLTSRFTDSTQPLLQTGFPTSRTWIDQSNTLFGTTGGGIKLDTGNLSPSSATNVYSFSGSTPYSITTQIVTGPYDANTELSLNTTDRIVVPVPAGLVLVLTGIPALGLGTWFRRRRKVTA